MSPFKEMLLWFDSRPYFHYKVEHFEPDLLRDVRS